jgi:hypothetical protein
MLSIPERVYLVSQLSHGLDKLVDSGVLKQYSPPSDAAEGQRVVTHLTAVVGESGVKAPSPDDEPDHSDTTYPVPLSKPRPKTWHEIQADVDNEKKGSSACTIL